jgi:hypothetical protein
MKNYVKRGIAVATLLLASGTANATSFFCDGQVTSVGINNNATLLVSYGPYQFHGICTFGATAHPEACRAWDALLLSAQAQGKTIRVYYDSSVSGNPSTCSGLAAWGSYGAYFVQTLD